MLRPIAITLTFSLSAPAHALTWTEASVADEAPTTADESTSPPAAECIPTCREGYLCHEGTCISACNPPCESGAVCTSEGQCESAAAPAAAATEVEAPASTVTIEAKCMGDHQCRRPRLCEGGKCIYPRERGSADEVQEAGDKRIKAGKVMMGVGGAMMGLGIIFLPIGLTRMDRGSPEEQAGECGDLRQPSCPDYGLGAFVAGAAFMAIGGAILLAGGITFGVGKKKLRIAEQKRNAWRFRPRFSAGPSGATIGLDGRF